MVASTFVDTFYYYVYQGYPAWLILFKAKGHKSYIKAQSHWLFFVPNSMAILHAILFFLIFQSNCDAIILHAILCYRFLIFSVKCF